MKIIELLWIDDKKANCITATAKNANRTVDISPLTSIAPIANHNNNWEKHWFYFLFNTFPKTFAF